MEYNNKSIRLEVGDSVSFLPVEANLESAGVETFEELKTAWEGVKWGYYHSANVELVERFGSEAEAVKYHLRQPLLPGMVQFTNPVPYAIVPNPENTEADSEFDVIGYSDLMINPEHYSTPWDSEPDGRKYISEFAVSCTEGRIYSKDFAYFECDDCGRTICEQNPANGWHVQYRNIEWGTVCLRCYEASLLANGVDIDKVIEEETLPGMFFNRGELESAGFKQVEGWNYRGIGMTRTGISSEKAFFEELASDRHLFEGKIVVIEYESMAIGGLGGYVTFWVKDREAIASQTNQRKEVIAAHVN